MATIPFQTELALAFQHMRAGRVADAEAVYRSIVARDPAHPQANSALAMLAEAGGAVGPAIEHLLVVVDSQPQDIETRLRLAANLRKLRRDEEALKHFQAAARLDPSKAAVYNNMGNICRDLQRAEDAERYLLKAIELDPKLPEAHNNLGALYSEQGRVDEAIAEFRDAIDAKSDYVKAHRNLSTTRKHETYDEDVRAMERLYCRPGATTFDKMHLGFGLGKACEELHAHAQAFEYWAEANRCQRVLQPYDIRYAIAEMRTMRRIFDGERLHGARGASASPVPIFVVGMPRSGTSLTEQILASHSAVFGAGELELVGRLAHEVAPGYPGSLSRLAADDYRRLGDRYLEEIAERARGASYVVDKLPMNFFYVGMIRMMLADAKIIHCRRNLLDTALSCFKNHFLSSRLNFTCDLDDLGVYSRHYEALMEHWRDVMPNAVYDSSYEALVAEPEAEIPKLLESCGLPFENACLSFHETRRMVATASALQVKEPIHRGSVGKWRTFEQELQPFRDALERPVAL